MALAVFDEEGGERREYRLLEWGKPQRSALILCTVDVSSICCCCVCCSSCCVFAHVISDKTCSNLCAVPMLQTWFIARCDVETNSVCSGPRLNKGSHFACIYIYADSTHTYRDTFIDTCASIIILCYLMVPVRDATYIYIYCLQGSCCVRFSSRGMRGFEKLKTMQERTSSRRKACMKSENVKVAYKIEYKTLELTYIEQTTTCNFKCSNVG